MAAEGPSTRGPSDGATIEIDDPRSRIVDAALTCIAEYGLSKTTLEDVAGTAGCSRATIYRYFPGKQALVDGVLTHELSRLDAALDAELAAVDELEETVVRILGFAGREFAEHAALATVLAVEPDVVLPHVAFDGADRLFDAARALLTRHLEPFLGNEAPETAEWLCRVAVTYVFSPSDSVSLTDPAAVRRLVRTYVLPGLRASEPVSSH